MADARMSFSIETDPIMDAARDLAAARNAVTKRHGDQFREFERRLDALMESGLEPRLQGLEDGTLIVTAPQAWTDLLAEARKLGLI